MLSIHLAASTQYYIDELARQKEDLSVLTATRQSTAGLLPIGGSVSYYISHPRHTQAFGITEQTRFDFSGFNQLRIGRTATGQNLRQRQQGKTNVEGFDFTFSAPKSLSVLWCLGIAEQSPELATVAWKIHMRAVTETLDFYSNAFAFCRKGKSGKGDVSTGTIAGAIFNHYDSRPSESAFCGDPQLHSHCVIFNSVYDGKTFRALDARPIMKKEVILALGQAYQKAISDGLHGHQIDQVLTEGAEGSIYPTIAAIPQPLISAFSRRSDAIRQHSAANGISRQTSTLVTRQPKRTALAEQLTYWQNVFRKNQFSLQSYRNHKPVSKEAKKTPKPEILRQDFLSRFRARNSHLSVVLRRFILADMGNPLVALSDLFIRLHASRLFTPVSGRIAMLQHSARALTHVTSKDNLHHAINQLAIAKRYTFPQVHRSALQRVQELLEASDYRQTRLPANPLTIAQENSVVSWHTDTPQLDAANGVTSMELEQEECPAEETRSTAPRI